MLAWVREWHAVQLQASSNLNLAKGWLAVVKTDFPAYSPIAEPIPHVEGHHARAEMNLENPSTSVDAE